MSATVSDVSTPAPAAPSSLLARRVLRRPLGAISLGVLALMAILAVAAPVVAPYPPLQQDLQHVLSGPSGTHLLGTDDLGRDVLSRLLYGGRVTLRAVAEATGVTLTLGVPIGLLAGYLGGRLDAVVMRVTDVMLSIPSLIVLLVVLAMFGQDEAAAMVALGVLGSPNMIRVVRGSALAVRHELYITAARVSGLSTAQIARRHILPRVAGPVVALASLVAGGAALTETGLAYLGLGVQEPQPSWGGMVATASNVISQDPWLLVPSGLTIALTVLAFGLLGDAVEEAMSEQRPRARRRGRSPRQLPRSSRDASPTSRDRVAAPPLLSLRNLSVAFADGDTSSTAIQDVSFDVAAGETVGLVGESGCGKTVTARAILGLLPDGGRVTGGRCLFDGADLVGAGAKRYRALRGSQIALISQEPIASLDPNRTVGAQIRQVVRRHHDVSRAAARARAIELLRRVRMPDPELVARRYPHEISGGMAQRVCIAAALAGDPRLLIADEPTTALDVTVQAEILDLLRDLQQDTGMAILLVTHDWGVVADICHRAVVMYAGEVVESTNVSAIFRRPLHPYTDALLRSNPQAAPVGADLPAIPGVVPPAGNWPQGCHFHPRWPLASDACSAGPIPLEQPVAGRLTRCIHHDELLEAGAR